MNFLLLIAAMLGIAQQDKDQQSTNAQNDEIVVTGTSREALDQFVESITASRHGKQIARWNRRICPAILGLDPKHGHYILGRLMAIAQARNIRIAKEPCTTNVVVVATNDADTFKRKFVERYPRLFQDTSSGVAWLDRDKQQFLKPRPVSWIGASRTGGADGEGIGSNGPHRIYSASRLKTPTRENTIMAIMVVDAGRMSGVNWEQLASYLSFIALADPDPTATFTGNTILSLFNATTDDETPPDGLTDLDSAYLDALYSTRGTKNSSRDRQELKSIASKIVGQSTVTPPSDGSGN